MKARKKKPSSAASVAANTPKGKPAIYPLAPSEKDYTASTRSTGGVDVKAQRASEMPSLSKTMGLGELPASGFRRGEAVDAEGVSMNSKYARQQANPNVKFKSGGKMYAAGGGPVGPKKKPTIGGQQTKQTRVEQGVNPIPSEYDMTTAAGKAAYIADRRAAQQNRIARKAGQRNMTAAERNADNALMGKQAQAKVYTGLSPDKYVIGGGNGVKVNPDLKAAASQRGSQTASLRPRTSSTTVLPRTRRPMNP